MSGGTKKGIAILLLLALAASGVLGAAAAGGFAVDDGTLATALKDTYVTGSGGTGQIGSSTAYVMTGSGLVTITESGNTDPGTYVAEISGTVSVPNDKVKVGLYYESTAVSVITVKNVQGSGFRFGYYDGNRNFQTLDSTTATEITVRKTDGSSYGVTVTDSAGNTLYTYDGGADTHFSVEPIISSGKAVSSINSNTYYGGFSFYRYNGGNIHVINVLDIEDYVKGVIPYEMSASWPVEALKAQACCARTYMLMNFGRRSSLGFDLYNTAVDQVYRGTKSATSNSDAAVDQTAGLYVTYNGQLAQTYYFAADGGATESSQNIWVAELPYLQGVFDPYEADIDFYCKSWSKTFTTAEISAKLSKYGISELQEVKLTLSDVGNVIGLTLVDGDGSTYSFQKSACTQFLSALGFQYTSYHFTVIHDEEADKWTVSGGGSGHNIGMSQWGAYSMASVHGKNFQEILGFYYRGVSLSRGV